MRKLLEACYDWRVIAALAAIGVGVFLWAPSLVGVALPLLLVAACPLSMILMMRTMGGHAAANPAVATNAPDRAEHLRAALAASRREQQRLMRELEIRDAESTVPVNARSSSPPA